MSNKLSLLLSLIFVLFITLFGIDLIIIQSTYSALDSLSELVSYRISNYAIDNEGNIEQSFVNYLKESNGVDVKGINNKAVFVEGDFFKYVLSKEYSPIFISQKPINISITRYAVIGINDK